MIINSIQPTNTQPMSYRKSYPNLAPLRRDTVSFGYSKFVRSKDLMDLKRKDIIEVCVGALKKGVKIGQGQEAEVYKIPDYAMQYCLRREKSIAPDLKKLRLNFELNKYDKANFVVGKLGEGLSILKFIPGIPLLIKNGSDTPSGIKVKQALQELVANNFPEESFIKPIELIEKNRANDIIFDRKGENLLVDAITQEITPIDYSPQFNDIEYNPISYIYHALDVDKTKFAPKVLGKLCNAYAERLKTVNPEELNLNVLDKNFYCRGFMEEPFNYFPDRALLEEVRSKLFDELLEAKFNKSPEEFNCLVDEYKDFVERKLINKEALNPFHCFDSIFE